MDYKKIFEKFFEDFDDESIEFVLALRKEFLIEDDKEFSDELLDIAEYGFTYSGFCASDSRVLNFYEKYKNFIRDYVSDLMYSCYGTVDPENKEDYKEYVYQTLLNFVKDDIAPEDLWDEILNGAEKFKYSVTVLVIEDISNKYRDIYYDYVNYEDE